MGSADAIHQSPHERRSLRRRMFAAEVLVAALAVVCFGTTLANSYCHDDVPIVEANPQVIGGGAWLAIWTTDYWGGAGTTWEDRDLLYRPVAVTSYRIVQAFFPAAAGPQHFVNVILHALLAVLVLRLGFRLTDDRRVAWVAGLLFAALPIHSEVVASIVGRADILATLGVVAAMLAHGRMVRCVDVRARLRWLLVSVVAVFVAMGAKESGIVAPICVVAIDWFFHRKALRQSAPSRWLSRSTLRRLWYVAIPVVVYLVLRINALDGAIVQAAPLTKTMNVLAGAPMGQRVLGAVQLWGMYWVKTAWPATLNIDYSINAVRLATSLFDPYVLVGVAVLFALVGWAIRQYRRGDSTVAWAFALCILCYLPTSNAFVLLRAFFAERIWYLPSVWVVILLAVGMAPLFHRTGVRVLLAIVLFAMAGRCVVRNSDWRDNRSLYAAAYRDHPDGVQALRLYGHLLAGSSEVEQGIALLRRAIDIDLGYTDAYRDLGRALLSVGKFDEALHALQTAEMQSPGHAPTVAALREAREAVAESRGDVLAAQRQRVAESPDDVAGHLSLVTMLRETGDLRGAIDHLRKNDSRFGGDAQWAYQYAVTLIMLNDLDGAIVQYRRAVQLAPKHIGANVELAMLLLERDTDDDIGQAWQYVRQVERIAPNDISVLVCRGELLAHDGKTKQAIESYRRAVAIEPKASPRRNALMARLRALGG
jgi:protein O-mannosyl-transferase